MLGTEEQVDIPISPSANNYLKLYDADEQRRAWNVANFLEFGHLEISQSTGVTQGAVAAMPAELRRRLMEIGTICELVAEFFHGDVKKTILWFNEPNMMLGNISPRSLIRVGRYKTLYKFIVDSLSGYAA